MTCRRCGLKHPGTEGCKQAKARMEREICDVPVVETVPKLEGPIVANVCPICEERRLRNLESVRRYRAKGRLQNV